MAGIEPLAVWLDRRAVASPERAALEFAGRRVSYRALGERAGLLAEGLRRRRIGRGDRVAFLGHNRPEQIELLFACARLGAMLVPLNWRLAPPEWLYILRHAEAAAIVAEPEFRGGVDAIVGELPALQRFAIGAAGGVWRRYDSLIDGSGGLASPAGALDDPVLLVYTSGTTGRPKGALLTQAALGWNARNSIAFHALAPADRVLTFLPMFHVGGLNIQTVPALAAGAEVLLHRRFDAGQALAAIARDRPTLTLMVPAVMKALVEHPAWPSTDLSSLRMASAGSSIVPLELIRAFHARGVPVTQVYGSTETAPIAIALGPADARRKEGSTGLPAAHCRARIVDEAGNDVARGTRGEILIRGPNVTAGYWRDPDATAAALADGWFRTGDIGHQDDDGYYWIDDRKIDVIISGGENVYPAELEAILGELPEIAQAAVVARPDPRWGEVPVAVVTAAAGARVDAERVRAAFRDRVARFKQPRDVVVLERMPTTALGKIAKGELRAMLAGAAKRG